MGVYIQLHKHSQFILPLSLALWTQQEIHFSVGALNTPAQTSVKNVK
jgi:hypothetical protein